MCVYIHIHIYLDLHIKYGRKRKLKSSVFLSNLFKIYIREAKRKIRKLVERARGREGKRERKGKRSTRGR